MVIGICPISCKCSPKLLFEVVERHNLKVIYVLQECSEEHIAVLESFNADYLINYTDNKNKIANQCLAIEYITQCDILVFLDADIYIEENTIDDLIKPILIGSKVSTGKRQILDPPILYDWSLQCKNLGIYGGLFAVDYKWFMSYAYSDFKKCHADDWSVYLSAKRTDTKISYSTAVGYSYENNVDEFLKRQYSWMRMYCPVLFFIVALYSICNVYCLITNPILFLTVLKAIFRASIAKNIFWNNSIIRIK